MVTFRRHPRFFRFRVTLNRAIERVWMLNVTMSN